MTDNFPNVHYADADGVSIAYAVQGLGQVDLVRVPDVMSGVLAGTVRPELAAYNQRLANFARLIMLDRRGLGLSDPFVDGGAPPLEQQVEDVLAVMDAVGSRRAALHGAGDGGQVALLFAAMHPDRVRALILTTTWARAFRAPDYPFGPDPSSRTRRSEQMRARWGNLERPWGVEACAPSRSDDPSFRQLVARVQQVSASPAAAVAAYLNAENDVREVLPLVQAPTLVLCPAEGHPRTSTLQLLDHAQFLVDHIPNARLARWPGADPQLHLAERAALIEEFVTGVPPVATNDRILASVLFTDIVASTERLADLGDPRWRALLDQHDSIARTELRRFRGHEVKTTGDGLLASFDGPARAVGCARAITDRAKGLGINVRAGVHVGECEVRGDDLAGIAVHIGARVCALAAPGEVLTTSIVRDLVAGSGLAFTERGSHLLKGVPGTWTLLAADA